VLLQQRFEVKHACDIVWNFFGKMEAVVPCMPGASLTEPPSGNSAKFKFNVKLGPITATFLGEVEVERDDANFRGIIRGNGRDNRGDSRVTSVVEYALTELGPARTAVDVSVDFTLTGRLAQFSRAGIVNDLAARLTGSFAQNLEAALMPAAAADAGESTTEPAVAPRTSATEINAGGLLMSVLWDRIKAFFRSVFGRW